MQHKPTNVGIAPAFKNPKGLSLFYRNPFRKGRPIYNAGRHSFCCHFADWKDFARTQNDWHKNQPRVSLFTGKSRYRYLPTRTGKRLQQEKFYGDRKISFNVFEYLIVSKYVFGAFFCHSPFINI